MSSQFLTSAPYWLGVVVTAGGGGAAVAFGLFKTFGTKWLDSRFSHQLEKLKRDHAAEMEHLRFRIAQLLDRTSKLNQREFEVLPDIWQKATDAHYKTQSLIAIFKEGVDLTNMSDGQLDAFLDRSEMDEWQKTELKAQGKFQRSSYYSNVERNRELYNALLAGQEFNLAVHRGSIYINPDAFQKIDVFANRIWSVLMEWKLNAQMRIEGDSVEKIDKETDPIALYRKGGQEAFDDLGKYLRSRYWADAAQELAAPIGGWP